jgi:hypothetical protein
MRQRIEGAEEERMRAVRIGGRVVAAAVLAAVAPGCGGGGHATGGDTWEDQTPVSQLGKLLKVYRKGLKPPAKGAKGVRVYGPAPVPPPRGMADLQPIAKGFPLAMGALRKGDVLLYWNTDLSEDPNDAATVLAFAKEAPETGGEVLLRDGSTRWMSAEAFKSAKKPEGATTEDKMPIPAGPAKTKR